MNDSFDNYNHPEKKKLKVFELDLQRSTVCHLFNVVSSPESSRWDVQPMSGCCRT